MRRFFVGKEGQFSQVRREKVIGVGIAAHLGHVHEARVGRQQRLVFKGLEGHEHAIVPIQIREEIVEGQTRQPANLAAGSAACRTVCPAARRGGQFRQMSSSQA